MIVEYTHRIVAATVTILIAALVVLAWRRYRSDTTLVRSCMAALGLVVFQAALGGLTVEKGLKEELVAAHLGIAMLQIGLLLFIARASTQRVGAGILARAPAAARPRVRAHTHRGLRGHSWRAVLPGAAGRAQRVARRACLARRAAPRDGRAPLGLARLLHAAGGWRAGTR